MNAYFNKYSGRLTSFGLELELRLDGVVSSVEQAAVDGEHA